MRFFHCVAKALVNLVKPGIKLAFALAEVDKFAEFAVGSYKAIREAFQDEAAVRQGVAEVAPLSCAEARVQAAEAVAAVAPQATPEQQREMIDYLTLLPDQARRSLRRFEDATGTTVPATQRFQSVKDLLPFLPSRLPVFKAGDRPPGIGDWELVELLGRGGFGEVWKAHNPLSGEGPVALKFTTDPSAIKILHNELGVLNRVRQCGQHRGIVRLQHTYLSAHYPCLEFEYVPGFELSAMIRQLHAQQRPAWQSIHPRFLELVDILAFTHQADPPIVHCDLKPANILVQRQANGEDRLRLLDFGIGGLASYQAALETQRPQTSHSELLTKAARGAYTPLYASPQQKERGPDDPADPRDDIHALGVIWYQMLTGDLKMVAFPTNWSARLKQLGVPPPLRKLLGQCVSPDEADRPANAAVLLKELQKPTGSAEQPLPKAAEPKKAVVAPTPPGPSPEMERQRQQLSGAKLGDTIELAHGMKFAWVPPGQSWLGGGGGGWFRRRRGTTPYTLPAGLWCGVYPVTQAEWQAVVGDAPSHFKNNPRYPVESVSWDRVTKEFLTALNMTAAGSGLSYRLPTEQEWEYICRGGPLSKPEQSAYHFYFSRSRTDLTPAPTNDLSDGQANFDRGQGHPSEVGLYLPNPLGIYDLHGNVWEWTSSTEGSGRVIRGGGWHNQAANCTAAYRCWLEPGFADYYLGFRLLAVPSKSQ
jgi:formylglycine-generating enzyme required for sulfatase activity/serine/threonine protein kinase